MKKIVFTLSVLVSSFAGFSQQQTSYSVTENNSSNIVIDVKIGDMKQSTVTTPNGKELKINIDKGTSYLQKGAPDVPKISFSILIPNQKNSEIEILSSHYAEYTNIDVAPSKGKILRTVNPADIPYTYGDAYQTNAFFPSKIADLNTPYIMRDFRGQTVQISPVQYNPITKILRVYSDLKIKINYSGISNVNTIAGNEMPAKIDEVFDGIYENQFINYKTLKKTRYSPLTEDGNLLILCPATYIGELTPFVKWKEMKGFKTFLVNTDTITGGVNETTIGNTAKYYYQNMQIAFMILVGDNTNIPSKNESFTNPNLAGPSDIAYAYINNNDHYPEFIVGRFSGETTEEIRNIVNRSLAYEKTPNTVGNWMSQQMGIASDQGTGDDNQYDFEHEHDIVDSNKNQYNYINYYELYDGVASQGWNDAAGFPGTVDFETNVNSGVSLINYTGHGSTDGIVTTGFSTPDVPALNNANKLPFMFVVGCSPGNFRNQTCFAEALIRAGSSTIPLGTLSSFMSCIDQYWDEPMQAQDEFNAIMRGARPNNLKTRLGALCVNGCCSMNDQYNTFNDVGGGISTLGDVLYPDLYVFRGETRSNAPSNGPFPRARGAMAEDRKGDLVVFGGIGPGGEELDDTWRLVDQTWEHADVVGPPARVHGAMVFDGPRHVNVLFGGETAGRGRADTWEWDGTAWSSRADGPETARPRLTYDLERERVVLFRDAAYPGEPQLFEWDGEAWTPVCAAGEPEVSAGASAVFYDRIERGVVVIGRGTNAGAPNEVWVLRREPAQAREACSAGTLDVDGDGMVGCDDPDCAEQCRECGDTRCQPREQGLTCPMDCLWPGGVCGDFDCAPDEARLGSCPGDC